MTSPILPEQARKAIDAAEGATDYTWADAHHALETVAGMREEWGVKDIWGDVTWFIPGNYVDATDEEIKGWAKEYAESDDGFRLVRRYVTEVIDGDCPRPG